MSAVGGINIPTFYPPDAPEFANLEAKLVDHDIPLLMDAMGLGDQPLPLLWACGDGTKIRFPALEKKKPAKVIRTSAEKAFLMMQDAMADVPTMELNETGLRQEVEDCFSQGRRIARCMVEFAFKKRLASTANSLLLSFNVRVWSNTKQRLGAMDVECSKLLRPNVQHRKFVISAPSAPHVKRMSSLELNQPNGSTNESP